jgi:L-lactate dehydrogenase complex protein LldF
VKIDISDQILKWRRVMARKGLLPLSKRLSFPVAGHVFGHPLEYRMLTKVAEAGLNYAPDFLLYNETLNPWGRHRQMPQQADQSFRDWYLANRRTDANTD